MSEHAGEKRRRRIAVGVAGVCASVVLACCIGFNFAAAGNPGRASFGLSEFANVDASQVKSSSASDASATDSTSELASNVAADDSFVAAASDSAATDSLTSAAQRDITKAIEEIAAEEEAARIAAEEAARAEEQARIQAAEAAKAKQASSEAAAVLSDVDWSVGKDAFIAEWTSRIDNYLAGSPLAGYGSVFATAAWENGVDPRWSPAISNTESSKGLNCFKLHNAWGWGQSSWSSWEEAINAHIAGLAEGYGYSITYENAMKYCPPNYDAWYHNTLNEMATI